jgi:hypothetical protein
MRDGSTKRWILLAGLHAVLSLLVLQRLWPAPRGAGRPPAAGTADTRGIHAPAPSVVLSNGLLRVFDIPVPYSNWLTHGSIAFRLRTATPVRLPAVQVCANTDSHRPFIHDYVNAEVSPGGFVFTVPLRGSRDYWHAQGHDGEWSDWESVALRALIVKVFLPPAAVREPVRLTYAPTAPPASPLAVRWVRPLADPIALGGRFELAFDLDGWRGNPFDPEDLAASLEVRTPSNRVVKAAAFLYQNFEACLGPDRERIEPKGAKHWRVRYRPCEPGEHRWRLLATSGGGSPVELAAGVFRVTPGSPPDFLRVSDRSPFYFAHADGRFFYPVGWCILSPIDRPHKEDYVPYLPPENSLSMMRKMLDDMADSGCNFARFWMTEWWTEVEWGRHVDQYGGIGRYNLKNAWLVDQILEHAERRGIRILFATMNHLRTWPPQLRYGGAWADHPYAARNGGFLADRLDYWTDPRVLGPESDRLRYIVARFADSPAIHSWDYLSESDLASRGAPWEPVEERMAAALAIVRAHDPYRHPAATHTSDPTLARTLERRSVFDFLHSNAYADCFSDDQVDSIRRFSEVYADCRKPALVTEYAGRWCTEPPRRLERDTVGGLWAGMASRLSGVPMSWWWNFNYGEDLGPLWRVAADFMAGEDLVAEDTSPAGPWRNQEAEVRADAGSPRVFTVGNSRRRFGYVFNYETICRTRVPPTRCLNTKVVFSDLMPGPYAVEFWDPRRGRMGVPRVLTVREGMNILRVPDFDEGWAFKLRPADGGEGRAPTNAPVSATPALQAPPTGTAFADTRWSWRVRPLLEFLDPRAVARCVLDVRVALPDECYGAAPDVRDESGRSLSFAWQRLDDGRGWHIRMPAAAWGAGFAVRCATNDSPQSPAETLADDHGLRLTTATHYRPVFQSPEEFDDTFAAVARRVTIRAARVDDVENPTGPNYGYLSYYQGPLFVPVTGTYRLASNSDDGSFIRLDGRVVVSWPGQHDMEQQNGPNVNHWLHDGTVQLKRGVHWFEYGHQNCGGARLARAGWQPPAGSGGDPASDAWHRHPLDSVSNRCDTIGDRFFDGRLPHAVTIERDGQPLVTVHEAIGLEVRKPRRRLHTVVLSEPPGTAIGVTNGWVRMTIRGQSVPVWIESRHFRPFSMEWERAELPDGRPALRTLLHDLEGDLELRVGERVAGVQRHGFRQWCVWPLLDSEARRDFVVRFAGVEIARGRTDSWVPNVAPVGTGIPESAEGCAGLTQLGGLVSLPLTIPAERLRAWWPAVPDASDTVSPVPLSFDPWRDDVRDLPAVSARHAVLFVLDTAPYVLGLNARQVETRAAALVRRLAERRVPVMLALDSGLDFASPLQRAQALAFMRVRDTTGCPVLDLRTARP